MRNQLNLNNILDSLSSLAILLVSGLLIWTFFTGNPQPPPTERLSGEILEASQYWPVQGDSNLAIIEFVDFECPYCKAHTMDILPHLQEDLISTGDAEYISLQFPMEEIHPRALGAAKAAVCAGEQSQYWEMHSKLFSGAIGLARSAIDTYAAELDLDMIDYANCIESDLALESIQEYRNIAERFGIAGTPTFLFGVKLPDGRLKIQYKISGIREVDTFTDLINDLKSNL